MVKCLEKCVALALSKHLILGLPVILTVIDDGEALPSGSGTSSRQRNGHESMTSSCVSHPPM